MTLLLIKGVCDRLPSSCASAPSSPTAQTGNLEKEQNKKQGRRRECLRCNSTKRICQQNLITVIYGKSFIAVVRQAYPCPTVFCYQDFFPYPTTSFLGLNDHSLSLSSCGGVGSKGGPVTPGLTDGFVAPARREQ